MRTSSRAVKETSAQLENNELNNPLPAEAENSTQQLRPQLVRPPASGNGPNRHSLRMYTEEQVAEMLQVSMSQLRKWRMKQNGGKLGPPFRKIGRLVRYPESALLAYINGE
jgi:predicted DNA-binding transcriptional regulator AlpA